ncbi:MAG: hypothetical protein JST64_10575, partial [Actinobacteria bacterium]|nr:hypothetical protein [Actinomycetota bacterium]
MVIADIEPTGDIEGPSIEHHRRHLGVSHGPALSRVRARTLLVKAAVVIADVTTIALAYLLATWATARYLDWPAPKTAHHVALAALTLPVWPILFSHQQMYASRFLTRLLDELRRTLHVVVIGTVALIVVGWLLGANLNRWWVAVFTSVALALVSTERFLIRRWFVHRRRSGRSLRPVVIVGTNGEALDLAMSLSDRSL